MSKCMCVCCMGKDTMYDRAIGVDVSLHTRMGDVGSSLPNQG